MNAKNLSLINEALSVPYAAFYWRDDADDISVAYVNAENGGSFTPAEGTEGNRHLTGKHQFVQIERSNGSVEKFGSYDELIGDKQTSVGDGTNARLEMRDGIGMVIAQYDDRGNELSTTTLCAVDQLAGISILHRYGEQHRNYRFVS